MGHPAHFILIMFFYVSTAQMENMEMILNLAPAVRIFPLLLRVELPRDDWPHVDAESRGGGGGLAVHVLLVGVEHIRRPHRIALKSERRGNCLSSAEGYFRGG